jgi:hypothetical protein
MTPGAAQPLRCRKAQGQRAGSDVLDAVRKLLPEIADSMLQRRWRDARMAAQHVVGSDYSYRLLGGFLAGAEPASDVLSYAG